MKIVTYNVNGLRPRISQHGSLLKLLNSLDADIICFQEIKLSRQELTADVIIAVGYESFFSCTRAYGKGRSFSGVATFCRVSSAFCSREVALPLAAEEGFTGLLGRSRKETSVKKDFLIEMPAEVQDLEAISEEDMLKVDSEGRCIITDHGHFVLFNIYGPRAESDDAERIQFKITFFKILLKRWESLSRKGKRIIIVGDLNIAPAAIDRCSAGPDFEENEFRKWLRSLLVEGRGLFVDVFRAKHPHREAYTCWSVNNGAEEFNCGSRIDHILISGSCLHEDHATQIQSFVHCHVEECDIMTQFKRWKPENGPRWKRERSIKLEGSDHVPVFISLREIPNLPEHNTPSLAARYVPEIRGFQQTIVSLLQKKDVAAKVNTHGDSNLFSEEDGTVERFGESVKRSFQDCSEPDSSSAKMVPASNPECEGGSHKANENLDGASKEDSENQMPMLANEKPVPLKCTVKKKKLKANNCLQRTLQSFFQKKPDMSVNVNCGADISVHQEDDAKGKFDSPHLIEKTNSVCYNEETNSQKSEFNTSPSSQDQGDMDACDSEKDKNKVAVLEWQRIQLFMQNSLPLCKGHGEPCVVRVVKKAGPNFGRRFYVCARSEGPESNPETNCGYFKWAASKSGKK